MSTIAGAWRAAATVLLLGAAAGAAGQGEPGGQDDAGTGRGQGGLHGPISRGGPVGPGGADTLGIQGSPDPSGTHGGQGSPDPAGTQATQGGLVLPPTGPEPAPAVDRLRLGGFGTLGLVDSHYSAAGGFRREVTQPSHGNGLRGDVDTRLGLQATYALGERLQLGTQLVLKDPPPGARADQRIEWAYLAWQPTADWTLRIGRINPDIFLLSDYRNVGFAYTWARPDPSYYGPIAIYGTDGIDLSYRWQSGEAYWKGKLFRTAPYLMRAENAAGVRSAVRLGNGWGLALTREERGLAWRLSVMTVDAGFARTDEIEAAAAALDQLQALPDAQVAAEAARLRRRLALDGERITFYALGMSLDRGAWVASAELARVVGGFDVATGSYGYAMVGRRFGAWTLYGGLSRARSRVGISAVPDWAPRIAPVLGPEGAGAAQALAALLVEQNNLQRQDQQSVTLGARLDLHAQLALKLQFDHFRIRRYGSGLWGATSSEAAHANVATVLLDFVF